MKKDQKTKGYFVKQQNRFLIGKKERYTYLALVTYNSPIKHFILIYFLKVCRSTKHLLFCFTAFAFVMRDQELNSAHVRGSVAIQTWSLESIPPEFSRSS